MVGHRPSDDPPRVQVLDVREVQESLPRRDVGDVGRPGLVRSGRVEVPLDQIGSDPDAGQSDRRAPALTRQDPRDTGSFHQPLDTLAPNPDPVLEPQLGVDAPGAIGAIRLGVDLLDPVRQPRVGERPVGRRSTLPVVKARAVHAEHPAHQRDREVGLLRRDERERLAYRSSVSLAKKARDFFTTVVYKRSDKHPDSSLIEWSRDLWKRAAPICARPEFAPLREQLPGTQRQALYRQFIDELYAEGFDVEELLSRHVVEDGSNHDEWADLDEAR
jgi:hypothetical protein